MGFLCMAWVDLVVCARECCVCVCVCCVCVCVCCVCVCVCCVWVDIRLDWDFVVNGWIDGWMDGVPPPLVIHGVSFFHGCLLRCRYCGSMLASSSIRWMANLLATRRQSTTFMAWANISSTPT
ncbi:hypothetical protein EJ05DRAFT_157773 [Pseudovirgaria hyperparasitica]|uniref:Secreted protein n=1 Tax=Pseudovirgaria hyperparasitica TaxID=470096 RepID=A0A6A6VVQ7_9PEZI|nr:uncharacterized protein EJ05DRAFT_157773 [Pseudovirgaria hyperparasitica]KAF2753876.1 hypothetical protein EJ05DRAFT_157773 [Pseudovirgaria hyperparasitica]